MSRGRFLWIFRLAVGVLCLAAPQAQQSRRDHRSPRILPVPDVARLATLPAAPLTGADYAAYLKGLHQSLEANLYEAARNQAAAYLAQLREATPLQISNAAVLCWYNGQRDVAIALALQALLAQPEHATAANTFAAFLSMSGYQEKAIPILEHALLADAENSTLLNNLGHAYLGLGEVEKARQYFLGCVRRAPIHPEANLGLAAVAEQQGDTAEARSRYERSLEGAGSQAARSGARRTGSRARLVDLMRRHFPGAPEYFNPHKYQMPDGCRSVARWNKWVLEYRTFQDLVSSHHRILGDLERAYGAQAAASDRSPGRMQQMAEWMRSAPFHAVAAEMVGELGRERGVILKEMDEHLKQRLAPELERLRAEYRIRYRTIDEEYRKQIGKVEGEGGDATAAEALHKARCQALTELTDKALDQCADLLNDAVGRFVPRLREATNEIIYWSYWSAPAPRNQAAVCSNAGLYLRQLLRFFAFYVDLTQDRAFTIPCKSGERGDQAAKAEVEEPKPYCPFQLGFSFGLGKVSFSCDALKISSDKGLILEYEKRFDRYGRGADSTLAIGVGFDIETGVETGGGKAPPADPDRTLQERVLEAGTRYLDKKAGAIEGRYLADPKAGFSAEGKFYVKFDKDNTPEDVGMIYDYKATIQGGPIKAEAQFGFGFGVNSSMTFTDPGVSASAGGHKLF